MPQSDTTELLHLFSKVRTEKDMERYLSRHASKTISMNISPVIPSQPLKLSVAAKD